MRFVWMGVLSISIGCSQSQQQSDSDLGSATDHPNIPPVDTDTDPPVEPISTFRHGQWIVDNMRIVEEQDLDQDGTIDNKLPAVLNAVDLIMGDQDLSLTNVNHNIQLNIDNLVSIVLIEAMSADGVELQLDVLRGRGGLNHIDVHPDSYDQAGVPLTHLVGELLTEDTYRSTGTADLWLTMVPGLEATRVVLEEAQFGGHITGGRLTARIRGVIPVNRFIDEVVDPMIPADGIELTPGNITSKADLLQLIRNIGPQFADVTLQDGSSGVSAAFYMGADAWTF